LLQIPILPIGNIFILISKPRIQTTPYSLYFSDILKNNLSIKVLSAVCAIMILYYYIYRLPIKKSLIFVSNG